MIRMFSHHFQLSSLLLAALNAVCVGLLAAFGYLFFYPATGVALLNSAAGAIAIGLASAALVARFSFNQTTSAIITRRVLVLGVGRDAAMVNEALDNASIRGLAVVGFYSIDADQQVDAALPANKILPPSKSIGEIPDQIGCLDRNLFASIINQQNYE